MNRISFVGMGIIGLGLWGCGGAVQETSDAQASEALSKSSGAIIRYVGNDACPLKRKLTPGAIAEIAGVGLTENNCQAEGYFKSFDDFRLSSELCSTFVAVGQAEDADTLVEQVPLFSVSSSSIKFHVSEKLKKANGPAHIFVVRKTQEMGESKLDVIADILVEVEDSQLCLFSDLKSHNGFQSFFGRFQVIDSRTGTLTEVTAANPAKPGDIVVAYATGAGNTTGILESGKATPKTGSYGTLGPVYASYTNFQTGEEVPFELISQDGFMTLRTPDLVGVDQVAFRIPDTARADADGTLSLWIGETNAFTWLKNPPQ